MNDNTARRGSSACTHRAARLLAAGVLALALTAVAGASAAADWKTFKQAFVSGDGRIVDYFQNSMSHSEGQGYGLLLAALNKDREAFDRILQWTHDNLRVRRDALHAWSWGRRPNGLWSVIDYNNASDGDALIAWALILAADCWNHPAYREAAREIVRDMRVYLAVSVEGFQLIAPAYYGFERDSGAILNTGYFVFPAYRQFARIDEPTFWERVLRDSQTLLARAHFSEFQLPADWVLFENGRVSVYGARSPFFGYEAIRLPLYQLWGGQAGGVAPYADYLRFVERVGYVPNRVNVVDGSVALDEAPAGFYAVLAACAGALEKQELSRRLAEKAASKIDGESKDYFSNSLYLLAGGTMD
jgi:endoglucanase